MLVSVIVPVYNTERYLPVCLDSIINQTYKNIEIILVDDGSTDGSLEICTRYASIDPRIIVIKEEHKGLVVSRKRGIKRAEGEYCIFVDSDDWIALNLLETVLAFTDNGKIDIVNYNMRSVDGDKYENWRYTIPEGTYEDEQLEFIFNKMMFDFEEECSGIIQSLCTKLLKRDILWSSIETMDDRITLGEDAAVVYNAMLSARKIVIINDYLYFYRIRHESMCRSVDIDIFTKIYFFREYLYSVFEVYSKKYRLHEQLQAYLLQFVKKGIEDVFILQIRNLYRIPLSEKELGKRIVLYGAGAVGRSYYRQLKAAGKVEISAWIDNSLSNRYIYDYRIDSLDILHDIDFDKVLIAVKKREIALEIKNELEKIIPGEKILWGEPKTYWWEKEIDI